VVVEVDSNQSLPLRPSLEDLVAVVTLTRYQLEVVQTGQQTRGSRVETPQPQVPTVVLVAVEVLEETE
jgi:hypothetical protein